MKVGWWIAAVGLALILAGCSDDPKTRADSELPAPSDVENAPPCDQVWVPGHVLAADYQGCMDGSWFSVPKPGPEDDCLVVMHQKAGTTLYATLGDTIAAAADLTSDKAFEAAIAPCLEHLDPS